MPLISIALANLRGELSLPGDILIFLLGVVGVALGGRDVASSGGSVARLRVAQLLLHCAALHVHHRRGPECPRPRCLRRHRRRGQRRRGPGRPPNTRSRPGRRERRRLANLAGSVLRGQKALPEILQQLRETYGLDTVTLLERPPGTPVTSGTTTGTAALASRRGRRGRALRQPDDGDAVIPVDDDLSLVLSGRTPSAADRQVLGAFAAQAAVALRQEQLEEQAERVRPLAEADRMRTALLNAVSHDLRTPLASATAAVDSLRSTEVEWSERDRSELLEDGGHLAATA